MSDWATIRYQNTEQTGPVETIETVAIELKAKDIEYVVTPFPIEEEDQEHDDN